MTSVGFLQYNYSADTVNFRHTQYWVKEKIYEV